MRKYPPLVEENPQNPQTAGGILSTRAERDIFQITRINYYFILTRSAGQLQPSFFQSHGMHLIVSQSENIKVSTTTKS